MDEQVIAHIVSNEELLRIEKALRGATFVLDRAENAPPSVQRDVQEALRLVEEIRGR